MGSGEVAIVALSTMISLKVTFSDGLGGRYVYNTYGFEHLRRNKRFNFVSLGHSAVHIQPLHIRRTHSTFSTFLPRIYTVFPVAHRLAPKYAILAHFCNRLTFRRLPSEEPIRLSTLPIPPCG